MSAILVFVAYAASVCLAFGALLIFHRRPWYWHVLSVLAALGLGVLPTPQGFIGPGYDLAVGSAFAFLIIWGLAAPLFPTHHAG